MIWPVNVFRISLNEDGLLDPVKLTLLSLFVGEKITDMKLRPFCRPCPKQVNYGERQMLLLT